MTAEKIVIKFNQIKLNCIFLKASPKERIEGKVSNVI